MPFHRLFNRSAAVAVLLFTAACSGSSSSNPPPGCPSGQVDCGGTCVNPQTSATHCGASGTCTGTSAGVACTAGQSCVNGACACPTGQVLCDGACIDPLTNVSFCGASGTCIGAAAGVACGAGQSCVNGACACPTGQVLCNGACIDPLSNLTYCGASGTCTNGSAGTTCTGGQVCSSGTCTLTCASNLVKCDGTCINPQSDQNHCGASTTCTGATAGVACTADQTCTSGACACNTAGLVNCGGTCINPQTSTTYCGASLSCTGATAGTACDTATGHVCNGGTCGCPAGQVDCGGTCINPLTDGNHCGASSTCTGATAGAVCTADQTCTAGACACNASGLVNCGGTCIDPLTSTAYCGASLTCTGATAGTACDTGTGHVCNTGTCGCPAGQVDCGGTCINPLTDGNHCGASSTCSGATAGAVCTADQTCTAGACACNAPGLVNCDGTCIDPLTDPNHCGASATCSAGSGTAGTACGGGATCRTGTCSALAFDWRPIRVDTLPPRFAEGASTKVHLIFNGTGWTDTVGGTSWVKVGTVGATASGMWAPQQSWSGPFSAGYWQQGNAATKTVVDNATSGDFMVCARFKPGQHPTSEYPTKILIADGKPEAGANPGGAGWSLMQMHRAYCFHYHEAVDPGEWMDYSVWQPPMTDVPSPSQAEWSYICGGRDGRRIRVLRDGTQEGVMTTEDASLATSIANGIQPSTDPVTIGAYADGSSSLNDGGVYEIIITTDPATLGNMRNMVASAAGAVRPPLDSVPIGTATVGLEPEWLQSFTGADGQQYAGPISSVPYAPGGFLTGNHAVQFGATLANAPAVTGACIGVEAEADDWSLLAYPVVPVEWRDAGWTRAARMQWDSATRFCTNISDPSEPQVLYVCVTPPTFAAGSRHLFQQCYDPAGGGAMHFYIDGVEDHPDSSPSIPLSVFPSLEDIRSQFVVNPNYETGSPTFRISRVTVCPSPDPAACQ